MQKTAWKKAVKILIALLVVYAGVSAMEVADIINPYWQRVLDEALIMTIGSLGLSIIYGFTGQFSLGHAAFYGTGAYAAGLFEITFNSDGHSILLFVLSLLVGAVAAALMALIIGLPILRLRSDYLGIATLGFGIIVTVGMNNSNKLVATLGGATGMSGTPQTASFDWIFIFLVLTIILVRNFVYSTYGRSCTAIREDEIAADVLGINTTKVKVLAFVLGCALAGFAGGLYAHRYPFLHPSEFDFLNSLNFLLIVVLGGLGSMTGTVLTAIGWVFLLEVLRLVLGASFIDFRGVIYALILIVAIIIRPQGIFSGKEIGFLIPQPFGTVLGRKDGVDAGSSS